MWLKNWNKLPDYYITADSAKKLGWNPTLGNLKSVAPGKMLTKGIIAIVMAISPPHLAGYGMKPI